MEQRIIDKINALKGGAASQEEFMKKLAELDENGQLTEEAQTAINGGAIPSKPNSPLIGTPVLGMWNPSPFPDSVNQLA